MATKKENSKESEDRKFFLEYVQSIYLSQGYSKEYIPWGMLTSQIKNILNDNKGWNHAQLKYVLWYMIEIKKVNLFSSESNGSILSLVPFYFIEAKDFALKTNEIKKSMKDFNFDYTPITIERDLSIDRKHKVNKKEIDMNTILD